VRRLPNRDRIDLDSGFDLAAVRPQVFFLHEVQREYPPLTPARINQLDAAGLLRVRKLGSRSIVFRDEVARFLASLPQRQLEAVDAAALLEAELEALLRALRLVRAARRMSGEAAAA
jgi:hypothetical protein